MNPPNSVSNKLLHTNVKYVNTTECNRLAGWEINPTLEHVRNGKSWCYNPIQFCARGTESDACHGDSGGPIFGRHQGPNAGCGIIKKKNGKTKKVCPFSIYGIFSYGSRCTSSVPREYYTVYVRLSYYADWILEKTGVKAVKTGLPVGNAVSLNRGGKAGPTVRSKILVRL